MDRHSLDGIGAVWLWCWPLPGDPRPDFAAWKACGVTGVVPQQSDDASAWLTRWGPALDAEGLSAVVGLGKVSAAAILTALDHPHAAGVMVDQEDWKSSSDSEAVVREVLLRRPDAASRTVDCFYPAIVTNPETNKPTGHARIAVRWAPLCGLRAPQCYWERGAGGRLDGAPDGWVARRLAHARVEYPAAGGSPAERVRPSVQLYKRSVRDHVALLLAELEGGSVWLWDWKERDASAVVALEVVAALKRRGFTGAGAVRAFQLAEHLAIDGLVGPRVCRALGLDAPSAVVWSRKP